MVWQHQLAQVPQIKFLHLNTSHGLPDGTVRSVTQDRYGYIWLATQYGLCRYNGYQVNTFLHNKTDSGSISGNFVWSVFTDVNGNVWSGNDHFLSMYRYSTHHFVNYDCPFNAAVTKIVQDEQHRFWLATSGGLMAFDSTGRFTIFRESADTTLHEIGSVRIHDLFLDTAKSLIYLATQTGFKRFNYHTQKLLPAIATAAADQYPVNTDIITAITKDKSGNVWLGCGFTNSVILRLNEATGHYRYYHDLTDGSHGGSENRVLSFFTDKDGNVWAGGLTSSLSLYLAAKDKFYHFQHDALVNASVSGTSISNIFQDNLGMIWVGPEGYGADRFYPGNSLFTSFQPSVQQPSLLHDWGRAAIEDRHGNIWFGTSKGISVYDTASGTYANYQNNEQHPALISFNTIRSFAEDKNGDVWIGTGNWLNRFNPQTKNFRIYNFGDSLKSYFVWAILATTNGVLYVGGTGGLQRFDYKRNTFCEPDQDSMINKKFHFNVRNIFEDSYHGLWIGLYDGGLLYYHPAKKITKLYKHDEKDSNTLCNNFVTSVIEDKSGIIWISTRDGLNSLDTKTGQFRLFTTKEELPSNKTSGLRVDGHNKIWVATGRGLSVMGAARKFFLNFDMSDGLTTNEFNDQLAATTQKGEFIYPTYRGFIMFDPEVIQQRKAPVPPVYISGFQVFNKPFPLGVNSEDVKAISLRYNQDFFSIELTALNFENPDKVFFAYKLAPFNKDWVYTQDRNVTYTNLTGGDYTFYYKATTDPSDWNTPVRELSIHISTVFYKTTWFIILCLLLAGALLYGLYRYRLFQARNLHQLQLQATRLEKDKTEIQYQNLMNQFNPHFLFNSLTSLNSLIYENRELASDFLEQLSAVYRYLLTHKETQLVSVQTETEFVHHYISLLKTRFEDGLQVTINIPSHLWQKKVVPVTFQLLIENAIKHNIIDATSPLMINISADDQYMYVANNLQKKGYVESSNRKGLESLQTLYKYLSSLPVEAGEEGEKFIIRVPLL